MVKITLIFGRTNTAISLLIRRFDLSPWSHVAIVAGDYVYESTGSRFKGRIGRRKGVIKTPLAVFKKRCSAWRLKEIDSYNENWLADCERMVKAKTEYDMRATLGSAWFVRFFGFRLGEKHLLNCSECVNAVAWRFIKEYNPTVGDFWRLAH